MKINILPAAAHCLASQYTALGLRRLAHSPASGFLPGGELPYEEYMGVCHELGSHFHGKIPKRVCQFITKIPERAITSVRNSI